MIENLIVVRNILYKLFIINFVYLLLVSLLYLYNQHFFIEVSKFYYGLAPQQTILVFGFVFSLMKVFTAMGVLFPALAIHWTVNCMKKKQPKQPN